MYLLPAIYNYKAKPEDRQVHIFWAYYGLAIDLDIRSKCV